VPTPLKFLGRYVGQPGELTYAKDIHRYYEQLARVSPRARYWKIGKQEGATWWRWRSPDDDDQSLEMPRPARG
jgi:hypothetical protein